MSIATQIQRLISSKADIKTAIENKGVPVPASAKLDGYAAYIDMIQQFGGASAAKDYQLGTKAVVFIDYDGTVLYEYSAAYFAQMTSLPPTVSHEGLTTEGWNWTLENAKAHVAKYGQLTIGHQYHTPDQKTRLYISITDANYRNVPIHFEQDTTGAVTIDWGDGSSTTTISGTGAVTTSHLYAATGDYIITLYVAGNAYMTLGTSIQGYAVIGGAADYNLDDPAAYLKMITKVEFGRHVILYNGAFKNCSNLETVVMSSDVQAYNSSGHRNMASCFYGCSSLKSMTLSSFMGTLGSDLFYMCRSLVSVSFPAEMDSVFTGGGSFHSCVSLHRLEIPEGVTGLGYEFAINCVNLDAVIIPDGVTTIGDWAFYVCQELDVIWLPSSLTYIGENAFAGGEYVNNKILYFHLKATIPPTLAHRNAFNYLPSGYRIYVPQSNDPTHAGTLQEHPVYAAYIHATNWVFIASHIYEEGTDYHYQRD